MHATHGWNNRKTRFPVEIDAVAHRSNGSKVSVRVSNFSEMGCRIETDRALHIGERLQIAVPRMGSMKALKQSLAKGGGAGFIKYVPKNGSMNVRFLEEPEKLKLMLTTSAPSS